MKRALSILIVIVFAIVFAAQIVASGEITEPVPFEGKRVKQVSLGYQHSAAITEDGDLYLWGRNYYFQLGNDTLEDSLVPIKIMENVAFVSLGDNHSAAITTDGSLYTWGFNSHGSLGNGTQVGGYVPTKIMDNVASVSLGLNHSAAITTDGSLYMWGQNEEGQLGNGKSGGSHAYYDEGIDSNVPIKIMDNVASVSLGQCYSAAITTDGSLYMWGDNWCGKLGNGKSGGYGNTYDEGIDSNVPIKIMDNVVSVSLGDYHSAAITTDGSLYMWGENRDGQLGDGTRAGSYVPIKIMDNVASVSLGDNHSAAITTDGSLYMWGVNWHGQLGTDTVKYDSPVPIKIMDDVASVSLGYQHSGAITADGSLYMWGYNCYGQLGNGTTNINDGIYVPIRIIIPEDPPYTPADVNGDEDVTLDDAILTLQHAMKVDGGTPDFIEQAADLTGDGTITLDDAIEILKIAMKVTG